MTSEPPYLFVSYASADRERVLPVVDRLEQAGVKTWVDREGIHGGANYAQVISDGVKNAAALLLFASPASLASRNVRQEIALGWRYEKPYLPLLLDPVTIPDELAYWLEGSQWIEVLDRPEQEWLRDLARALKPLGIVPRQGGETQVKARRSAPLLVGRSRELDLLGRRLAEAEGGSGGLILIGGEAGIGKTALAETMLAQAEDEGFVVLEGHCFDLAESPPYGPWIDLFAHAPPLPGVSLPAAFAVRGTVGAVPSQLALFTQVEDFFRALAAKQPVVLLLDDLHWSDLASLDLLRYLARSVAGFPLLILVTYRGDELTPRHPLTTVLPQLAREQGAERIDLGRLDDDAMRELVTTRYGLPETEAARLAGYLQARVEGNALFAGEMLRALEESGALRRDGARWVVGELAEDVLPPLLRQVIESRVARFDDESRRLLSDAAVIGQTVSLPAWAAVSEVPENALLDLAERALAAGLLEERPDGKSLHFSHALIREALYESIPTIRRHRLHLRIAEVLAQATTPDPDAVAYHFQQAGDPRAVEWLSRAGERSLRLSAYHDAIAQIQQGLALLANQPAGQEHTRQEAELYTDLGVALVATRGWPSPEVGEAYGRAQALYESVGDTGQYSRLIRGLWGFEVVRGELATARRLGEQTLALAESRDDQDLRLVGDHYLGSTLFHLGQLQAARQLLEQAIALYDAKEQRAQLSYFGPDLGVFSRAYLSHVLWHLGYADQAVQRSQESIALARRRDHPYSLALALDYAAMLHQFRGEPAVVYQLAEQAVQLSRTHDFAYYLAWGEILRQWALPNDQPDMSRSSAVERSISVLQASGARLRLPYYLALLAQLHLEAGEPAQGLAALQTAWDSLRQNDERHWEAELHRVRAELLLAQGAPAAEAEAELREAIAVAKQQGAGALELRAAVSLGRLLRDQGRRDEASRLLREVRDAFTEGMDTADLRAADALLGQLQP